MAAAAAAAMASSAALAQEPWSRTCATTGFTLRVNSASGQPLVLTADTLITPANRATGDSAAATFTLGRSASDGTYDTTLFTSDAQCVFKPFLFCSPFDASSGFSADNGLAISFDGGENDDEEGSSPPPLLTEFGDEVLWLCDPLKLVDYKPDLPLDADRVLMGNTFAQSRAQEERWGEACEEVMLVAECAEVRSAADAIAENEAARDDDDGEDDGEDGGGGLLLVADASGNLASYTVDASGNLATYTVGAAATGTSTSTSADTIPTSSATEAAIATDAAEGAAVRSSSYFAPLGAWTAVAGAAALLGF
jgi:hypothetical protein